MVYRRPATRDLRSSITSHPMPSRAFLRIANIVLLLTLVLFTMLTNTNTKTNTKTPMKPPVEGFVSRSLPPWHSCVDIIYYINLDTREDRRTQFLAEMANAGVPPEKIVRITAVAKPGQGDWGCSLSHRNTLEQFLQTDAATHRNCLIFEDDFMFTRPPASLDPVFQELHPPPSAVPSYDVCMLSCNPVHTEPTSSTHLLKVYDAQTASGYLVSRKFAPTLFHNYQEGTRLIEQSYHTHGKDPQAQHSYCIDQYWKRLQPSAQWYVLEPTVGKQRDSYSDIQGGFVRMTV